MFDKDGLAVNANKLCLKCVRGCRQSEAMVLLGCPRFIARPFKVDGAGFAQLELFDALSSSSRKRHKKH